MCEPLVNFHYLYTWQRPNGSWYAWFNDMPPGTGVDSYSEEEAIEELIRKKLGTVDVIVYHETTKELAQGVRVRDITVDWDGDWVQESTE